MSERLFIEENLPDVLSNEELMFYFKHAKTDVNFRNKIVHHNIKLVLKLVSNNFYYNSYDKKELVSVGLIGLIKAVDSFDINKDINFSTYACTCIINSILKFINSNKKVDDNTHKFTSNVASDTFFKSLVDNKTNIARDYEDKELIHTVLSLVDKLPARDKDMLMLYFKNGYTEKQIAEVYHISRSRVGQILRNSLSIIRSEVSNIYDIKIKIK